MKKGTAPTPAVAPATRKKRGDTPEKMSPATSAEPNDSKRVDVIWDEALESLRIKEADWIHQPDTAEIFEERRSVALATVAVKKRKQLALNQEMLKESTNTDISGIMSSRKKVVVVKVAPESSKVKEFVTAKESISKHDVQPLPSLQQNMVSVEKKRIIAEESLSSSSIVHHEKRMIERHKVQEQLMTKLDRQPNELAMNVETREKEFQRDIIDRVLPYAEMKGHGFWKGAEFWRQHKWIGGEERGIFDTPGQVQRGFPAPVERANLADAIRYELGLPKVEPPVPIKIAERARQLKRGHGLAGDLEPRTPDLRELIVLPHRQIAPQAVPTDDLADSGFVADINSENLKLREMNDRVVPENGAEILSKLPDVAPSAPVPGPALVVCDQMLKPLPPSNFDENYEVAENEGVAEARLVFECMAGGTPCKNIVALSNPGTTVIFYSWRRLPVENNFKSFSTQPVLSMLAANPAEMYDDISKIPPLPPVPPQRFYFDATDGVLLPGAKINLPVVFKSALAGVFSERWLLIPMPPAMPPVIVNFRGVAAQPDIHAAARAQLTAELSKREATAVCRALVRSLIDGVRTPPRPSSPIGAHGRRQKGLAFQQQNSDINFEWQKAALMEQLWNSACLIRNGPIILGTDTEQANQIPPCEEWDLSVKTLYDTIAELPGEDTEENEAALEQLLSQLNENVAQLGFSDMVSQCDQKATAGRIVMSVAADTVAEQALSLRQALGLPPPPDIPQQARPSSSVQQGGTPSSGATGRIGQGQGANAAKVSSALPAAHRGSATRGTRQIAAHQSVSDTLPSPPVATAASGELGIIRSPSDLVTTDPAQALVVAKYVDKLHTTSRGRIKDLINSIVDNVADLAEKRGTQNALQK